MAMKNTVSAPAADPSGPTADVTTPDIIAACARVGLTVNALHLTRWASHGLMPRPRKRGLGRGKGSEQLWDAECVPRAILIARTLKAGSPSLVRAAHVLTRNGYTVDPDLLTLAYRGNDDRVHRVRVDLIPEVLDGLDMAAAGRGCTIEQLLSEIIHDFAERYRQNGAGAATEASPQQRAG